MDVSSPETAREASVEEQLPGRTLTVLQRVLMPRPSDPVKVRSLYLDERVGERVDDLDRSTAVVPAGHEVSFATYFNAFPAGYWRRWTTLSSIALELVVSGRGRIDVYRSKADGSIVHVTGLATDGEDRELSFDLDLTPFEDGGWYWFDVTAGKAPVTVNRGAWATAEPAGREVRPAVGVCTYNRPEDCLAALATLAGDPFVLGQVERVLVADQGDRKVRRAARYAEVEQALGGRLQVFEQPNLGGSGGFARVMSETLASAELTHVLLLDDDVQLEPDSVARACAFARYAKQPTLVGGQMLALQDRSVLHAVGEVVDPDRFFWRAAPHTTYGHDFSEESLRDSPELHRRIDVDYTGWWMCLVPREALERIGLALPLFIKWDDAEYGLRAGEAGIPTVTLPGMAVWHLSWSDKDDTSGWQAYFHVRNRLVAAALHSPHERGGSLLRDTFKFDLKFLIMMQYGNTALHHRAYEDFLAGPGRLFQTLPTALPSVLRQLKDYPDGTVLPSSADLPPAQLGALRAEGLLTPPVRAPAIALTLLKGLLHNTRTPDPKARERPQMNVSAQDARWFLLSRLDSATVATADGRGVTLRYRDRTTFRRLLWRSIRLHRRLYRAFPALQREYRAALEDLTSARAWSAMWNVAAEVPDPSRESRASAGARRLFRAHRG